MRFLALCYTIATALIAAAVAQDYNQTAPFYLQIQSANETLNGATLFACHEGAAIEGLCLATSGGPQVSFAFNYTDYTLPYGILVYNFSFTGTDGIQSIWVPALLSFNVGSNVAVPYFQPDYGTTQWGFDENDLLVLGSYVDDTKAPQQQATGYVSYYRWYICNTYIGYSYTTLAWALGPAPPQNPTCQKVDVKRVYA